MTDARKQPLSLSRDEVAAIVLQNSKLLRSRIRHKLQAAARPLVDTDEAFSNFLERMDHLAAQGRVRVEQAPRLLAFLKRVAERTAADRVRSALRARAAERRRGEGPGCGTKEHQRPEEEGEFMRIMSLLTRVRDRELVEERMRRQVLGRVIAGGADCRASAAQRQRWATLARVIRRLWEEPSKRKPRLRG
jgi:hypothetical protein